MAGSSTVGRASITMAMALVLGPGGVLPASTAWATPYAAPRSTNDFDGLMAQAEEQRERGEHAAAARSYAAAYRALPELERTGLMGELAVDNALADFRAAYEQQPETRTLLEEALALVVEAVDERTVAHTSGKAEQVPLRLYEEHGRLEAQLRRMQDDTAQADPASAPLPPQPPEPEEEKPEEKPPQDHEPWRAPRWMWAGFGASAGVTFVVGTVTIVSGVWLTAPDSDTWGFRPRLIEAGLDTDDPTANDPSHSENGVAEDDAFFEVNPAELPPYVDMCDYNTHNYTKGSNGFYVQGEQLVAEDGNPGARDQGVAEICDRATNIRKVQLGTGIVAAVGLASTITFATLLVVHRRRWQKKASAWQRRGFVLQLGPVPGRGQGVSVGLAGRL